MTDTTVPQGTLRASLFKVALAMGVPALAELYTDWLWFAHVGYERVFLKSMTVRAILTVLAGLVVFALLGGNLLVALRALRPRAFVVSTPHGPQTVTVNARTIKRLAIGAAQDGGRAAAKAAKPR